MDKFFKLFLAGIIIGVTLGETELIEKVELSEPFVTFEIDGKITAKNGGSVYTAGAHFGAQFQPERKKRQATRRNLLEFDFQGTVTSKSKWEEQVSGINATLELWSKDSAASQDSSNKRSARDTGTTEYPQSIYGQFRFVVDGEPQNIEFRITILPSKIVETRIPVQPTDVEKSYFDNTFKGAFSVKTPYDVEKFSAALNLGIDLPIPEKHRDKRRAGETATISFNGKFVSVGKNSGADYAYKTEVELNGEFIFQDGTVSNQPSPLQEFKGDQRGIYLGANGNLTVNSDGHEIVESLPLEAGFRYYASQRRRPSREINTKDNTFEVDFIGDVEVKDRHYTENRSVKSKISLWLISQKRF